MSEYPSMDDVRGDRARKALKVAVGALNLIVNGSGTYDTLRERARIALAEIAVVTTR